MSKEPQAMEAISQEVLQATSQENYEMVCFRASYISMTHFNLGSSLQKSNVGIQAYLEIKDAEVQSDCSNDSNW